MNDLYFFNIIMLKKPQGAPAPAAAAPAPTASTDLFGLSSAPQAQAAPAQPAPADPFAAFSSISTPQQAAQPNLMDDFAGFGATSNPAPAQTNQPGPPMMNLMSQNNQPLISQSQPIMSTSTNQQFPMQSQQPNPMMFANQGMMTAPQNQGMMPQQAAPQSRPTQPQPAQSKTEVQSKVAYNTLLQQSEQSAFLIFNILLLLILSQSTLRLSHLHFSLVCGM